MSTSDSAGVRVLHKTIDILEWMKNHPSGMKLSELARSAKMPKATAYRILATLESRGFMARTEDGGYRLTRDLFQPQQPVSMEQILARAAQPRLEEFSGICRETVSLSVLNGAEMLVLAVAESPQPIRLSANIGSRGYLHSTAAGKMLLALLSEKEMLRLLRLKGLPRMTPYTITSRIALMHELERIREQGYAVDQQENELECRAIAAAIPAVGRDLLGAITISGPAYRLDQDRARALLPDLKQLCAAISAAVT